MTLTLLRQSQTGTFLIRSIFCCVFDLCFKTFAFRILCLEKGFFFFLRENSWSLDLKVRRVLVETWAGISYISTDRQIPTGLDLAVREALFLPWTEIDMSFSRHTGTGSARKRRLLESGSQSQTGTLQVLSFNWLHFNESTRLNRLRAHVDTS